MSYISKKLFTNTLVCPTLGWRLRNEDLGNNSARSEPTLGEKFRREQGIEVGNRARSLYPDALLISEREMASACAQTRNAIDDSSTSVILEGAFLIGGFATRADILKRNGDQWHLVEVKSSVRDKKEFIDDMAYTAMILSLCGLNISAASLLLISRDFCLGMENRYLFVEIDRTEEVLHRAQEFEPRRDAIENVTSTSQSPEPQLIFDCGKCPLFRDCLGRDIDNHISDLPRLSRAKFRALTDSNKVRIKEIPEDFSLTENQTMVWEAVQTEGPVVRGALLTDLNQISWPAYYLDFETLGTGIPLYPEVAPYTKIPVQYSAHKCSDVGEIVDHYQYDLTPFYGGLVHPLYLLV
jgi:CRISPR/Cas system-associated exonuclease Cas4 (RecB family)